MTIYGISSRNLTGTGKFTLMSAGSKVKYIRHSFCMSMYPVFFVVLAGYGQTNHGQEEDCSAAIKLLLAR